jgi:hypothetical protein
MKEKKIFYDIITDISLKLFGSFNKYVKTPKRNINENIYSWFLNIFIYMMYIFICIYI